MNPVAIIQARMTSTRLPGKVLADLAGRPLLERMIDRVRRSTRLTGIVVATTLNEADDPVAAVAQRLNVGLFRGDESDVLGRIHAAACAVKADPIVRLTADCPMSDPQVIDAALARYAETGADYVSNCTWRTFPDGLDVEVLSAAALAEANRVATHPELREHVTPYVRGSRPELGRGSFRRAELRALADFGHGRFTVDTADDLVFMSSLFARLPEGFSWLDAVALATRNPASFRVTEMPAKLLGLCLRAVTRADAEVLFRWLNEPDRRASSLTTAQGVAWLDHVTWLDEKLRNGVWMSIAVCDGIPAGVIRLDRERDGLFVSLYVEAAFRARGVGRFMLASARDVARAREAMPIRARVRVDNPQSVAFFENAGFQTIETATTFAVLQDQATAAS